MPVSYGRATRYAQIVAVGVLLLGAVALYRENRRQYKPPAENGELVTTSKTISETKSTPKGPESAQKSETTTAPNSNLPERLLGHGGLWVARGLLVLIGAFLAGALVQRMLLGKFAFKAGGIEIPELQAPPLADFYQRDLVDAFQFDQAAPPSPGSLPLGITSSSYTSDLLVKIQEPGTAHFAIINLGRGQSWLTTRLFLFAILLRRFRSVRVFVFLEDSFDSEKKYLGLKSVAGVRWLLAARYPWMEQAFAKAYADLEPFQVTSESGALRPEAAARLLERFMSDEAVRSDGPANDLDAWVQLASGTWEHARWINGALATELFNLSPTTTSFVNLGENKGAEHAFAQLGAEGPYVAVVDARRRFLRLLDREALLESLGADTRLKLAAAIAIGEKEAEGARPIIVRIPFVEGPDRPLDR